LGLLGVGMWIAGVLFITRKIFWAPFRLSPYCADV
jgi:hypothetical protein